MNWIKLNWFKIGLLFVGLIIALAIFNNSKPISNNNITDNSTEKDRQCSADGNKWFDGYKKESGPYGEDTSFGDPVFNYNDSSDRCYIRFTASDGSSNGRVFHQLVDVYQNKTLFESVITLEPDDANRTNKRIYFSGLTEQEFFDQTDLLMSIREP